METWRFLAGVTMGVTMCLLGVALASNFRGMAERHVQQSMSFAGTLRRVPPWRWLPGASHDQRLARFILLERVFGVALAAVGFVFLIGLAYSIAANQPMRMVK